MAEAAPNVDVAVPGVGCERRGCQLAAEDLTLDVRLAAGDLAVAVEHVSLAAGHPAAGAWEALSLHIESQACPNRRQSTVVGRPVERESCAREPWALLKAPPWRVLEAMATLVGPSLP